MNSCRTGVQQECQEDLVSVHTRSSAKQLLDRGHFVRLFLWILPNQKVTSLWVVAHTDMHRNTKRPAEHLGYWATGLLGYWATGLLGNRTKCRQKKVRVFFNVSGDSHLPRAKKSLEKHFTRILLLTLLKICVYWRCSRVFVRRTVLAADCFRFTHWHFRLPIVSGFFHFYFWKDFFGFSLLRCRGLLSWQTSISQTPPLSWYW